MAPHLLTTRFVTQGEFEHALVGQTVVRVMPDTLFGCCDSGAIDYMTGDAEQVFNRQVPPKGQEWVTVGDGKAKVLFVGRLQLKLHCHTDVSVQLPRVYVVDGLAINLFSLYAVQARHAIT